MANSISENKLGRAKELAINFVRLPLIKTPYSPIVVQHPFFESAILYNGSEMFNAFEDKEKYNELLEKYCRTINRCTEIRDILQMVRSPYKLTFLKYLRNRNIIDVYECGNLLAESWTLIEIINHDINVNKAQVLRWITKADKTVLMSKKEYKKYQSIPEVVTVYRGCDGIRQARGISWTLDPEVAEFFANRFGKGKVFCAHISKQDVIGYINDRDEQEIILNYNKLYDLELYYN